MLHALIMQHRIIIVVISGVSRLCADIRSPSHEPVPNMHHHYHIMMSYDAIGCDKHDETEYS